MSIKNTDPEIYDLITNERRRQAQVLELIASENYVSQGVLDALGSVLVNKYAEGYPRRRYYAGNQVIDQVEELAIERVRKAFSLPIDWHVNVQPHSGSPANLAVYNALLEPKDVIMSLDLAHGGHLTHGSPVSLTGKLYTFVHYSVSKKTRRLDYTEVLKMADRIKPKLILCGYTAYPRAIDFRKFKEIADKVKAMSMADISHIAGLVASGEHESPIPAFDVVTTTTHKTLRGPRGAVIMCKDKHASKIDKAVFPGLQGGPHQHTIAAIAVAMKEAASASFARYASQTVKNARALANSLQDFGFKLVADGTDTHMVLIDLQGKNVNGKQAQEILEQAGIVVNKNMVPFDPGTPQEPSGIRIGVAAVTTRGMKEKEMSKIAAWITAVLTDATLAPTVKKEVQVFTKKFPIK
jgi:glycine hydroxymethyltransferase